MQQVAIIIFGFGAAVAIAVVALGMLLIDASTAPLTGLFLSAFSLFAAFSGANVAFLRGSTARSSSQVFLAMTLGVAAGGIAMLAILLVSMGTPSNAMSAERFLLFPPVLGFSIGYTGLFHVLLRQIDENNSTCAKPLSGLSEARSFNSWLLFINVYLAGPLGILLIISDFTLAAGVAIFQVLATGAALVFYKLTLRKRAF